MATFRIEDAAGLSVERADLEYAFEVDVSDQGGPLAAGVAVLRHAARTPSAPRE